MIYNYKCGDCAEGYEGKGYYEKHNNMDNRKDSGDCPDCGSNNTRQIVSTPKFKTSGGGHTNGWDGKGVMK